MICEHLSHIKLACRVASEKVYGGCPITHFLPIQSAEKFYESDDVRYCYVEDIAILLDLREGEYVHLDPTATVMWRILLSMNCWSERSALLEEYFDVPASETEPALARFTQDLLEKEFIHREPARLLVRKLQGTMTRTGLPFLAWWLLLTTKRDLARRGFPEIYRVCRTLAKPEFPDNVFQWDIDRVERAFSMAENFFIMREAPNDCLPRSLALYRFLLACGFPADHCIGVKTLPFRAHAWVEFRGQAIRDSQRYVNGYTRVSTL